MVKTSLKPCVHVMDVKSWMSLRKLVLHIALTIVW